MTRPFLVPAISAWLAIRGWAADNSALLFTIERSTNANVIRYEAQLTDDRHLNRRQPVIAYWVMSAEDGRHQPLTMVERTKAYGFTIQPVRSDDSCLMALVSDRRREIYVSIRLGVLRAETTIGGHRAVLRRIFVTTRRAWMRNEPVSVELYGEDAITGEGYYEKMLVEK